MTRRTIAVVRVHRGEVLWLREQHGAIELAIASITNGDSARERDAIPLPVAALRPLVDALDAPLGASVPLGEGRSIAVLPRAGEDRLVLVLEGRRTRYAGLLGRSARRRLVRGLAHARCVVVDPTLVSEALDELAEVTP